MTVMLISRRLPVALLVVIGLFLVSVPTQAACTWSWDCTTGQCKQIPMCDRPGETPNENLRPRETPPSASPSLKPTEPYMFPPPGKSTCRQAYLCNRSGYCEWKPVCE